jgi:hypothetical protein
LLEGGSAAAAAVFAETHSPRLTVGQFSPKDFTPQSTVKTIIL